MKISRLKVIIVAMVCLLVSIGSVLTFLLISNNSQTSLSLAVEQITLRVGESMPVSYSVNFPNADLQFTVADKNIADVIDNEIYGIQEGKTILRAAATFESQTCYSSCELLVLPADALPPTASQFAYEIKILSGGYLQDSFLYIEERVCFDIAISINQQPSACYELTILKQSETLHVSKQFCHYIIRADGNGSITFALPDTTYIFTVHIIHI